MSQIMSKIDVVSLLLFGISLATVFGVLVATVDNNLLHGLIAFFSLGIICIGIISDSYT